MVWYFLKTLECVRERGLADVLSAPKLVHDRANNLVSVFSFPNRVFGSKALPLSLGFRINSRLPLALSHFARNVRRAPIGDGLVVFPNHSLSPAGPDTSTVAEAGGAATALGGGLQA